MSDPIITGGEAPVAIQAEDIRFYDHFTPPLPAGSYTLFARQTVGGVAESNQGRSPSYETPSQSLVVSAPRFALPATEVFERYPPAHHQGPFADHLAHVVLTRRTFPWSRSPVDLAATPEATPVAPGTPWVALLTFRADEIQTAPTSGSPASSAPVARPVIRPVADLVAPVDGVLTPRIAVTDAEKSDRALCIDLDYAFFRGIAPRQSELRFLAHGRQVDTDGKAVTGIDARGYFAVVTGNRALADGKEHVTVLVSLEGHWDRLPGGREATGEAGGRRIRLVVLASWSFIVDTSPGDFLALMDAIARRDGGVDLLRLPGGRTSEPPGTPDTDPAAQARQVLATGHVPLLHELRDGERTTSYYHGPCLAVPLTVETGTGPFHYSDGAIRYDPTFGTFDLSYAAAFQVGRLLALSDGAFAASLVRWRNDYFFRLRAAVHRDAAARPLSRAAAIAGPTDDIPPTSATGIPTSLEQRVVHLLHRGLVGPILPPSAATPRMRFRHLPEPVPHRPGLLRPDEIAALHDSGEHPFEALRRRLAPTPRPSEPKTRLPS